MTVGGRLLIDAVIVLGLSLITFPFYIRVRVHMRMSDEAFRNVRRTSLVGSKHRHRRAVFFGV